MDVVNLSPLDMIHKFIITVMVLIIVTIEETRIAKNRFVRTYLTNKYKISKSNSLYRQRLSTLSGIPNKDALFSVSLGYSKQLLLAYFGMWSTSK